jgi:acid stress chaperone HdeB
VPGHHRGLPTVKTVSAILVAISLVAVSLVAAAPASAQKLDLSKMTCKQFVDSGERTMGMIVMWLTGFFTDEDDTPIVDFDKLKTDASKMTDYCRKNPTTILMTAAEEILQ